MQSDSRLMSLCGRLPGLVQFEMTLMAAGNDTLLFCHAFSF
ncbi:hypothetical protein RRSWK_07159 [Rhodopirellula sp. SWK7]|nr:hypothetical protein RRSWK_07159 [Rhodopirellula sp. SWK7]